MTGRLFACALGCFAVAVLLPMGTAQADAIDGHWCHAEAGLMSIEGPQIVTPGGARMLGNYGRHTFSYVAPAAEADGGTTLSMILIDDDTVHLTKGTDTPSPEPQIWRRCPETVS